MENQFYCFGNAITLSIELYVFDDDGKYCENEEKLTIKNCCQ